ncbi:MAG: hypothetical protein IT481_08350 [Gammaproteobacteria bacterium]|nr:hypothetical protein [Gammaproteobacteria bacterium]
MTVSREEVEAAAAAIANARGGRRGISAITNVLDLLKLLGDGKLYRDVIEDARVALEAAERERSRAKS